MTRTGIGFAAVLACLLAGCTVGPKYKVPDVPLTPAYKEADGWKAAHPSDQVLRGPWWEVFGDPQLDALEEQVSGGSIFHTIYDLDDRYQVPGELYLKTGVTEKCFDCPPAWRGIYDDHGRLMAAMTFDSDLGDSWEWADNPNYDEKFSALGIRIGLN